MAITIYDVAKKAGVGIGTVSRAINNSPQISPKTREKILQVIKELKYQPHAMAQSLARKRTNTIACIVPDFTGYFFVELLHSIQREISKHNYDLILYSVDETEKKEIFLRRTLREKKVDGVLLLSLEISDCDADKFIQSKFPIVLIDGYHPRLDSIIIENKQGAYLATQHLLELGHHKVAMITGQLSSIPASIRLRGYKKALKEYQKKFCEQYVISVNSHDDVELISNHGFNEKAGYQAMLQLLELKDKKPTAVFISSDIQAIGAIRAIAERGLRIPEDIAIVGFDDIKLAELVGLTTMRQPISEMGLLAVKCLINKITNNQLPIFNKSFLPELIIRESSGQALNSNN